MVAYLKFEEVNVPLAVTGNLNVAPLLPVLSLVADTVWNVDSARLASEHNNANMVSLGERMMDEATALAIIETWMHIIANYSIMFLALMNIMLKIVDAFF